MKTKQMMVTGLAVLFALTLAGHASARGGKGGSKGQGAGNGACSQTRADGTSATRPAGSQRRDGSFTTTGVTANGATTRPNHGTGLQNGSNLAGTTAATASTTTSGSDITP